MNINKTAIFLSSIVCCIIMVSLTSCSKYQNNSNNVYVYTFSSSGFTPNDHETLGIAMPENSICLYKTIDCSGTPAYCDKNSYNAKNTNAMFSVNPEKFFTMHLTVRSLNKLANAAGNPNNYHCIKGKLNYSVFGSAAIINPTFSVVTCQNVNHSGNSFAYTPSCNTKVVFKKLTQ